MKTIVIGLFVLFVDILSAQTFVRYTSLSSGGGSVGTIDATLNNNNGVEGSVLLFKDWSNKATVYSDNGQIMDISNINYNTQDSKFISKISKDSVFIFYKIYKVEVDNKEFERINDKFYQKLYTTKENHIILKDYTVKIEPELHKITSTVIGPGKYVIENKYYIYKDDVLMKFKLNRREVLEELSSKKELVLKFVKSKGLSFTDEEDIKQIFRFYDSQ